MPINLDPPDTRELSNLLRTHQEYCSDANYRAIWAFAPTYTWDSAHSRSIDRDAQLTAAKAALEHTVRAESKMIEKRIERLNNAGSKARRAARVKGR